MAAYFVDSSALVKRYHDEAGSERVAELLDQAERLIVSRLSQVEVSAAIVRRARATRVSDIKLMDVLAVVDRDLRDSFDVVELDAVVIEQALALTRKHALRAADAIQLASALLAKGDARTHDFVMLASDEELNAAAAAEALSVVNPIQA